jgi:transposase InsO family protein
MASCSSSASMSLSRQSRYTWCRGEVGHPRPGRHSFAIHAEGIASIDLFVVRTVTFEQLFGFLVLGHGRRRLLWHAVTTHPTAEGWRAKSPRRSRGIRRRNISFVTTTEHSASRSKLAFERWEFGDRPTSFRAPWQNGYVERLIGSIRRECTDHLIVTNAEHLRRILGEIRHLL